MLYHKASDKPWTYIRDAMKAQIAVIARKAVTSNFENGVFGCSGVGRRFGGLIIRT
jgi:hypothetical protein